MKSFQYATPETIEQATALLADTWGETEVLAGGTDLITSLKQGITAPKRVVSLRKIDELKAVKTSGDQLVVGSATTLAELAANSTVKKQFPGILTAIQGIASPQIINAGSVGGDLCQRPRCWYFRNGFGLFGKDGDASLVRDGDNRYHAIFDNEGPALFVSPSSLGPILIALGATIEIAGPKGKKQEIQAAEFFRAPKADAERETALRPNEILTAVKIPTHGLKNAVYEVRHRHGLDWPYVTAAVAFQSNGRAAANARIVLGHVAPVPWSVPAAAKLLEGPVNDTLAAKCGEAAAAGAKPLSRNAYKVVLVKTAVKRAVLAAAQRA